MAASPSTSAVARARRTETDITRLKARSRELKRDTLALYLAARHPRTPRRARVLATLVAAYALSPIDLVPDFIPVIGYLDDLLIVPAGIALAVHWIPADVLDECRLEAERLFGGERPVSRLAASIVVGVWAIGAVVLGLWLYRAIRIGW